MQPFSRFARYFVAVAQGGSLRRAAEALNVSASAIDRQILLAEQSYGTPLFERLPQGLRLTAAGEFLLSDLQRWQKDHLRTVERFEELHGLRRGHVTIALIEALSEGLLPDTLARLGTQHPGLTYDLRVVRNDAVADQLLATEADIGLLLDPHAHRLLDCRASLQFPLGLVSRPDHPLAGRGTLRADDLMGLRLIVPDESLRIARLSRPLTEQVAPSPQHRLVCNDIRLIRALVASGQGVAILSQLDVAADLSARVLRFTPISDRRLEPVSLGIATAPHRQLSRAVQTVLGALTESLGLL